MVPQSYTHHHPHYLPSTSTTTSTYQANYLSCCFSSLHFSFPFRHSTSTRSSHGIHSIPLCSIASYLVLVAENVQRSGSSPQHASRLWTLYISIYICIFVYRLGLGTCAFSMFHYPAVTHDIDSDLLQHLRYFCKDKGHLTMAWPTHNPCLYERRREGEKEKRRE